MPYRLSMRTLGMGVTLVVIGAFPSSALAFDERRPDLTRGGAAIDSAYLFQPAAFSRRPLTLPRLTLSPDLDVAFTNINRAPDPLFGLVVGARFGILSDLEFATRFLPLMLHPEVEVDNLVFQLTYRLLRGSAELGPRLAVTAPVQDRSDPRLAFSIPVLVRLGDSGRLDIEPTVAGIFGSQSTYELSVPIWAWVQINEEAVFGVTTGFTFPEAGIEGSSVPLGASILYSVRDPLGPIADIGPSFLWPTFLLPGADRNQLQIDTWTIGFTVRVFIYLASREALLDENKGWYER